MRVYMKKKKDDGDKCIPFNLLFFFFFPLLYTNIFKNFIFF